MRIISVNVNGIRAAARKGFFTWLARQRADVVCLQELKAQADKISDEIFHPKQYHCYYFPAQRPGYSGVGIYTKQEPDKVHYGLGWPSADDEGRYVEVELGKLSVASLYLPSGSSREERQTVKMDFLDRFEGVLTKFRRKRRDYIICGDWNIAHKKIDIKNWRGNQKHSGFLPEEREWMDQLLDNQGYVDAFREVEPGADQYTWWSNRGQAWANNVGWRIDYQILSPKLRGTVKKAAIYKDERFSDHAPLIMDYDL